MSVVKCPVCGAEGKCNQGDVQNGDQIPFSCAVCGKFVMTGTAHQVTANAKLTRVQAFIEFIPWMTLGNPALEHVP